jgi:hypothetical protein
MPSGLAQAIANAEGYGVPGAIPTAANNPGDLVLGDIGYGTMGAGITVFGSSSDGWSALENQLQLISNGQSRNYSPGMSIAQIGQVWAGGDGNWAINVASSLGVSTSTAFASVYSPSIVTDVLSSVGLDGIDAGSFMPTTPLGMAAAAVGAAVFLALLLD